MNADLRHDAMQAALAAPKLLQAMVDVISSSGWLKPALAAMELSQMIVQAVWQKDPVLMQIPGVSREVAKAAIANGAETVFDVVDMSSDERAETLQITDKVALREANAWLDRYPDISVNHEFAGQAIPGEPAQVVVSLERESDGEGGPPGPVIAPHYPGRKDENWWLVVGDVENNVLLAVKRVTVGLKAQAKLQFVVPENKAGLTLFFMSDSYCGLDQEIELEY